MNPRFFMGLLLLGNGIIVILAVVTKDKPPVVDSKVLASEYHRCFEQIPTVKDEQYAKALEQCMINAKILAQTAVQ